MIRYARSLTVLAIAACTALPAAAQFGSLLASGKPGASPAASSGGGNIDQSLKAFSDKSSNIEGTLFNASTVIALAYATEEQRAKIADLREGVLKATDPKEADAKRAAAIETNQAIAQQATASSDLAEKTKTLSAEKKKLLAKGVALYLSGALQAKDLMPAGQNLLSSGAANPMNIGKLAGVKDALPHLANAVSFAGQSVPKLVQALKGANVKVVEPTSSSEKVADVSPDDFKS